jgi:hypothetical protein
MRDYPLDHTIDDSPRIRIRRIKAGSLFRLLTAAAYSVCVPWFVLLGILALFGLQTIYLNGRPIYGIEGLIAAFVMALIFSVIASIIGWVVFYVVILIWGHFMPITISYVPADEPKA